MSSSGYVATDSGDFVLSGSDSVSNFISNLFTGGVSSGGVEFSTADFSEIPSQVDENINNGPVGEELTRWLSGDTTQEAPGLIDQLMGPPVELASKENLAKYSGQQGKSWLDDPAMKRELLKAGLSGIAGMGQSLTAASASDRKIKADKELLELKNQQNIDTENRLAKRKAYATPKSEGWGFKDTGLLAAALKGAK